MPARPDPASLSAWRLLLTAHATVTELLEHELVAERGLPLSRYDVLLNLAEAPGGRLRMQELSASVLLSKSGLSRLVDRMVEAGLVRRERCEDDRRGWFAVLTDQGRSALRRAAPVLRHGDYHNLVEGNGFLLFERAFDGARAVLGVNLTDGEKVFSHGALGCRARVFDLTADRRDARKTGDSADETDAGTRGRSIIAAAPVVSLGGTLTVPPHGVVLALVEP